MLRFNLLTDGGGNIFMSEKIITQKDVEYVAKLARLAITDSEKARYEGQLERILEYVGQLKKVNTENVPPAAHPFDISNVTRLDEPVRFSDIPAIFKNAPDVEATFYRVKKVIEES